MAANRSSMRNSAIETAKSFGLPGIQVDGMDALSIRASTIPFIEYARKGNGPSIIEALTYRFRYITTIILVVIPWRIQMNIVNWKKKMHGRVLILLKNWKNSC